MIAGLVAVLGALPAIGRAASFDAAPLPLCGSAQVRAIAALDLNSDGADDVAAGCRTRHSPFKGRVEIWLSDGSGRFSKAQSLPLGRFQTGGEGAGPITAADFNEDGHPDLVIADTAGTIHGITVLYGKGGGTYGAPTYYRRPITWIATSDVNGDGHADLIPVLQIGHSFIPGDGKRIDPNAQRRVMARDTRGYGHPQRLDFNRDGRTDAVIPEGRSGRLHLFPSGAAAYDVVLGKAVRGIRRVMSGAHVDGDRAVDLLVMTQGAAARHEVRWVLTQGGAHLSPPILSLPPDVADVRAADFNGDNVPDLLVHQGYRPKLKYHGAAHPMVLMGKRDGGYARSITLSLPGSPNGEVMGDFDKDGRTDFIYLRISQDQPQAQVYLSRF